MNIKSIFIFLTVHYQLVIYSVKEKKQNHGQVIIRSDKNKNLSIQDFTNSSNQLNSLENNVNKNNKNNQAQLTNQNSIPIDKKTMPKKENTLYQQKHQSNGLSRYQIEQKISPELSNEKKYITYDNNNSRRINQNRVSNIDSNLNNQLNQEKNKNQESENYKEKYLRLINDYYLLEEKFLNKTKGDI